MREYVILIESGPNNFSAWCPDLEGVAATGATREECIAEMQSALSFHIECLLADGDTVPAPTSSAATVVVPFPTAALAS
jgi:predicted RNase H-like HicB family nuclease